ncbi:hypothetical protein D9M71_672790 [compost metagenome]
MSNPAHADSRAKDEYGMYITPHCSYNIKKSLLESGKEPTDIVTSTKVWDLQVYQNPKNGYWTLVGKQNQGRASSKLCMLASGIESYTQEKWYKEFF